MPARKRAAKPIEIALTEEQIEGIIEEAAARAGRPYAAPQPVSWGGSALEVPVAAGGAGAGGIPSPVPGDGSLGGFVPAEHEYVPLGEASHPSAAVEPPTAAELRELEEHRKNVIRQLRGREE